jgi:hypothetical protein
MFMASDHHRLGRRTAALWAAGSVELLGGLDETSPWLLLNAPSRWCLAAAAADEIAER